MMKTTFEEIVDVSRVGSENTKGLNELMDLANAEKNDTFKRRC